MAQYISKDDLLAQIDRGIEELEKKNYPSTFGAQEQKMAKAIVSALELIKVWIVPLDVRNEDLEKIIDEYFQDWQDCCDDGSAVTPDLLSPSLSEIKEIAKHFFELGLNASNSTTAADKGTSEEIIINLKRIESDYRIDLTKEIEWVRNQVKKGE